MPALTRRKLVALIRPAWESANTIVAAASEGDTQTLIRMGVDGRLEGVADPVDGSASRTEPSVTREHRHG